MKKDILNQIKEDIQSLGVKKDDVILIHSSFKSLGAKKLQPMNFLEVIEKNVGTLALPALSYMHCNKDNRVFDYHKTPSNIGFLPEFFRLYFPDVVRSLAPTHSCCAVGDYAEYLTSSHHLDNTPCGANSPFRKLCEIGGKILFLGCGTKPNTSMHGVEELVEPDYLWSGEYEYSLFDRNGKEHRVNCKAHGFKGVIQRYDRIEKLLSKDEISYGKILDADCVLMDAKAVLTKGEAMLHKDQHYFVDFSR